MIEHDVAARRAVEQRIGDQRHPLYRGVSGERFVATLAECVNAGVGPDVRPVASEAAQFDVVPVRFFASPENDYEFMLAAIEGALAGVGFDPDDDIQDVAVKFSPDLDQIADVTPIHADKMNCALSRNAHPVAERLPQECSKLRP